MTYTVGKTVQTNELLICYFNEPAEPYVLPDQQLFITKQATSDLVVTLSDYSLTQDSECGSITVNPSTPTDAAYDPFDSTNGFATFS